MSGTGNCTVLLGLDDLVGLQDPLLALLPRPGARCSPSRRAPAARFCDAQRTVAHWVRNCWSTRSSVGDALPFS